MTTMILRSGRQSESDGPFNLPRSRASSLPWSEVAITVFDASGEETDTATGIVTGSANKVGSSNPQAFTETVDLAMDEWSWKAELSLVQSFDFSIAGLNAGYQYRITVNNWN